MTDKQKSWINRQNIITAVMVALILGILTRFWNVALLPEKMDTVIEELKRTNDRINESNTKIQAADERSRSNFNLIQIHDEKLKNHDEKISEIISKGWQEWRQAFNLWNEKTNNKYKPKTD